MVKRCDSCHKEFDDPEQTCAVYSGPIRFLCADCAVARSKSLIDALYAHRDKIDDLDPKHKFVVYLHMNEAYTTLHLCATPVNTAQSPIQPFKYPDPVPKVTQTTGPKGGTALNIEDE